MKLIAIATLFNYFSVALHPDGTKKIKIGISLGFGPEGSNILDGAQAAFLRIKQLNEISPILGDDVALEPVFLNHKVSRDITIVNALEFQKQGVVAVVGSGHSSLSILTSLVLQNYKIPQCCGSSTNPSLSDKKQYPNFFRVIPTDASQTAAMMGYVVASGWKKIAIINTNEDYGGGLANYLTNLARENSVQVLAKVNVKIGVTAEEAKPAVQTVQESGARIIFFFGYNEELLVILKLAKDLGIFGKDYVWFASDALYDFASAYPAEGNIYNGLLIFYPREAAGPEAEPFANYWKENYEISGFPNISMAATEATKSYVYFFSSCIDLFLHGFDSLLTSDSSFTIDDLISGKLNQNMKIPDSFAFPEVATPSGYVRTDRNGDRLGDFDIYNFLSDGSRKLVGGWNNGQKVLDPNTPILYPGGILVQPKDGIDPNDVALYASASSGLSKLSLGFGFIGTLTTLVSLLAVLKYRNTKALRQAGVTIGITMQICLLLANSQFLLMIDKPTPVKCTIDSFVIPVLFSFYYGLLFAKNLRIYRIFYYPLTKKFLNQNFVYFLAFMFTLPSGVTSIIWNVFDPPIPTIVSPFQNQYYWTCKSARGMESIAIGIHIILNTLVLVANLGMAFMTRNVVSTYSETKMIGLSVYNMTVISIFDIVMLSSESLGFNAKYLVKTISILYVILFNLTTTFLYKVYQVHTDAKLSSTISNVEKPKPVAIVNKDGNVVESLVSVTEVGRYMNQSYEGLFRVMSPDCAMIFKRKKTSLESQITKDDGFGTGWFVSKLTKFACMERSPLIHRFYIDEKTYDIKYQTAEETAIWTQFFKSWSYRVQPDNMSVSSPSKQLSVI